MYMDEGGFQQFICLTARQVAVEGVTTKCQPNQKIPVHHQMVLNKVTYLIQSHYLLPWMIHYTNISSTFWKKITIWQEEVPDIQYVQIKSYMEYDIVGTIALFVFMLTGC